MSIAKGEVKVDVDKIVNLEKEVSNLNQTVGAQRESIETLKSSAKETKAKHDQELKDLEAKLGKEVIVTTGSNSTRCSNCGWNHFNRSWTKCQGCSYENKDGITYKGLDEVVDMIRKEESKKIKADTVKLEAENEDLTFRVEKQGKEIKRIRKQEEENITEAKARVRERMGGIIKEKDKEIEALREEIIKVQDDKTDIQIEEARKQEIIDLKLSVEEAEKEREEIIKLLPAWKRKQYNDKKAKREALIEKTEKEDRIEEISNNYPTVRRASKAFGEFLKRKTNGWIEKTGDSNKYEATASSALSWLF